MQGEFPSLDGRERGDPHAGDRTRRKTRQFKPRGFPDASDDWILNAIERRRTRLQQVSAQQRERIETFTDSLLDEDSQRCEAILDQAFAESRDPQKVVELLLEPAARAIGDNWCADECDFLKVTIAVSRMQRLFRRLTCQHPPTALPDASRCALLMPAPGDQHSFGLSVVEDAFRRGGWEVDCSGCGEEREVLRLVSSVSYLVIGISVSVERRLPELAAICHRIRARSRNRSIVLMAGGGMVMQNPSGVIDAGFDLLAVDAASAVRLADSVVASRLPDLQQRVAAE